MNLLFERSQTQANLALAGFNSIPVLNNFVPRPSFKLWAKIELDQEEQAIVSHYKFDHYILLDAFEPDLLRHVGYRFVAGVVIGFLVFFAMIGFRSGLWLGLLSGIVWAYSYYDRNRELMLMSDLLAGHYFKCKSIVDLARKEAKIEVVTQFLRQVMESAKHWDGRETIPVIAMSKEEAKRIVIQGGL